MTTTGRKPKLTTERVHAPLNEQAIAAGAAARDELASRSTEVAERYGDGLPYDRERLIGQAKFFMGQSAEAMLEAGKRLIQIKENELHGDFTQIVTEQLGLGERTARNMMQAAVKFLSPQLAAKRQTFAVLGRSKLLDLMVESEDDLEELAEGGTLAGHSLTDIESMSARELKKALAEARGKLEAKDKLLETKNKKIDELQTYTPTASSIARNEEEAKRLDALHKATGAAEVNLIALANVCEAIEANHASKAMRQRATQAVQYLVARLAEIIDEHGIDVSLAEGLAVRPDWLSALPDAPADKS